MFVCKCKNLEFVTNLHGDMINLYSDDKTTRSIWKCKKCGKMVYKEYLHVNGKITNFVNVERETFVGYLQRMNTELTVELLTSYLESTADDKDKKLKEVAEHLDNVGTISDQFILNTINYFKINTPGFPD